MNHPFFQNRLRLAAWWLTWSLLALGQLLLYYYVYGNFLNTSIPDIIISFTVYSGIGLIIWYPFRYFNKKNLKIYVLVSNILIMGSIVVIIWLLLSKYVLILIVSDSAILNDYWKSTFFYRLGSGVFIYFLIILTYYLIMSLAELAEKKAREAKLESVLRETELKVLRSQINPHFLFNTLNSISALTVTDPVRARTMVIKLSDFMRYALSRKDEQPVTILSELENIRIYLDIEKVRFGDRLQYEEQIDENCLHFRIPVLLLQPLYENAIKHGVHESTEKISIVTKISCDGNYVNISISNNFENADSSAKGTGTGLANVLKRLELYYGSMASMKTSVSDNIFTVTLFFPVEK